VRAFRNVSAVLFFIAMVWAAHPARAGSIDPIDGNAWCQPGYHAIAEYTGFRPGDDYPTCDLCCNGPYISAEEWCHNVDGGDVVNNNGGSCTCCKLNDPGGG
jgi:hypothetical protein